MPKKTTVINPVISDEPTRYLIIVYGDVEPYLTGPYGNEEERDNEALRQKREFGDDNGIYTLDINFQTRDVELDAYSAGFFRDWRQKEELKNFTKDELTVGNGVAVVSGFPTEAPWITPYGVGLVNIIDIRRNDDGKAEFHIANKDCEPTNAWVTGDKFYHEWPD